MNLDKLYRTGALRKETRQSDNLSGATARTLQTIRQIVLEDPADASLQQLVDSFRRALAAYDDGVDTSPAEAARRFTEEITEIIRRRAFGRAIETSLQKGYTPYDFNNRR